MPRRSAGSPTPWACSAWAWRARWCSSSATPCTPSSTAALLPTRMRCSTSPGRCSTSTPRWTTRSPGSAPASRAVPPTTNCSPARPARSWTTSSAKRSPTLSRRAQRWSPSARPAGSTSSCPRCPACRRRPRLLHEVSVALRMMELTLAADYLVAVGRYTENELIARQRVPNGRQLDTLADALASLEYYLEALRDQRGNRDEILDIARNSLEALGYWPLPEPVQAPAAAPPPATVSAGVAPAVPATQAGEAAGPVAPAATGVPVGGDDEPAAA